MSNLATVTRQDLRGMITLRGDLDSSKLKKAVKVACGHAMPSRGEVSGDGVSGAVWMSPDEVLVMVPYGDVAAAIAKIEGALTGTHFLAVDVSDARAVFRIEGATAHEVLARLCPVDLHKDRFAVGQFRRTRMAQVPAAFWRHNDGFDLICFLSVADYAQGVLQNAARATPTGALG